MLFCFIISNTHISYGVKTCLFFKKNPIISLGELLAKVLKHLISLLVRYFFRLQFQDYQFHLRTNNEMLKV